MSGPLVVQIGMARTSSFRTEAEGARQDMERIQGSVNKTSADLVSLQRAMRAAGGGTAEQATQVKALRKELTGLSADLRTAKTDFETLGKVAPTGGVQLAGGKRLRKAAMGLEGAAMAYAQGGDAAGAAIGGVQSAAMGLQLGLGPMIAIAGATMLAAKLHEGAKEAEAIHKELAEALKPLTSDQMGSSDALRARIKQLDEVADKAKSIGFLTRQWINFKEDAKLVWNGGGWNDKEHDEGAVMQNAERERVKQRTQYAAQIISLAQEENNATLASLDQGDEVNEQKRRELELKKALAEVDSDPAFKGDPARRDAMKGIVQDRFVLEQQIADKRTAGQKTALELEQKIIEIKRAGKDIEVATADAKVEGALKTMAAGPKFGLQALRNAAAANAAIESREEANRHAAEYRSQTVLISDLAGLTGSDAQKARSSLGRQISEKEKHLDPKNSDLYERDEDKRDRLKAEIAQMRGGLRQMDRADRGREFETRSNNLHAAEGRGPEEHKKTLEAEIALLEDRGRLITDQAEKEKRALGEDEQAELSGYAAGIAHLKKQVEDLGQSEKDRLATIREQTTAIQNQGYSLEGRQKSSNIGEHYDRQIGRARFEGAPQADIEALQKQKEAAQISAETDEEMMAPGQRGRRARQNQRRAQAEARVRTRHENGGSNIREADGNKSTFESYFHPHGRTHEAASAWAAAKSLRPDAHAVAPKTAQGQDFKAVMATAEGLLKTIAENCTFKGKGG